VLQKLAGVFQRLSAATPKQQVYKQIQIEGHTDTNPLNGRFYPQDNWELSTARALEVLKFLSRKASPPLEEKTMSASGYASNRPKAEWAQSRRIEILIYFSSKEAPADTKKY
jgi:chemotaxis protein MotB